MQKISFILSAVVLLSSPAFSKGLSESVKDIFNELGSYQGPAAPAVEPSVPESEPAPVVKPKAKPVPQPVTMEKAGGITEESSEPLVAADLQGFAEAVKPASASLMDRVYPRARLERHHRLTEIAGMEEVSAAWSTDMVFRSYSLGGDAPRELGIENVERATEISHIFPDVRFPGGASAIYQPGMQMLFVENTRDNLMVLEAILGGMGLAGFSTDTDQVEIEAKFVEVSEGTLEELGFEWNFDGAVEVGGDYLVDDGPNGLFADALRGSPGGTSPNLPFSRTFELGDGRRAAVGGDWGTFGITETFNATPDSIKLRGEGSDPFDLLISALDQSTGTDVLSAPRIVTRSGEEATIRVGDVHSYPGVYEGDASESTLLNISYKDFEEKLLGIEMVVAPEVDGDQIILSLNPKITELAGWQNYKLAPEDSIFNHRQLDRQNPFIHPDIVAKLPVFKIREIQTEVTIADGSTIGMGGLINEKIESFEDKVPVLGSIPFVGRLFRNEGERAVKRNLLIFVTAKKVDPSGRVSSTRSFE